MSDETVQEELSHADESVSTPRDWSSVRDWLNVAAALGALLVGVVTFWTTARISGFEDYLKSEVSRRNSELNALSSQTERLRSIADSRQDRIDDLRASTDEIVAAAIAAQQRIVTTESELARVSAQTISAQQTLMRADAKLAAAEQQLKSQQSMIDLFKRRRAYESAIMQTALTLRSDRMDDTITGGEMVAAIKRFQPQTSENDLTPYFDRLRNNADRACYKLSQFAPVIPEALPDPPKPTISYRRGASQVEIDRVTAAARDDWIENWTKAGESQRARRVAQAAGSQKILRMAFSCMCDAFSDESHGREAICRGTKDED